MDAATKKRIAALEGDMKRGALPEQEGRRPVIYYCPNCRTENGNCVRDPRTGLPSTVDGQKPCLTCGGRGLVKSVGHGKLQRLS